MKTQPPECDAFILDTCKLPLDGVFVPGAILFRKRKRIDAIQWRSKASKSRDSADTFVRRHFRGLGIREVETVDDLYARTA